MPDIDMSAQEPGLPQAFEPPRPGEDPMRRELAEGIIRKYRNAKKRKAEVSSKWNNFLNYFLGKQSGLQRSWKKDIVINYCFGMVEAQLPLLTDGRPQVTFLPTEEGDVNKVALFEKLFRFYWNKEEVDAEIEKLVLSGLIFGTGIGKVYWDQKRDNNLGEVEVEQLSPYYFYIDPGVETIEKARWVIHAEPRTVEWIQNKYGISIKPDWEVSKPQEEQSLDEIQYTFSRNTSLGDVGYSVEDIGWQAELWKGKQPEKLRKALVIEYWEKAEVPIPNPMGIPTPMTQTVMQRFTVLGMGEQVLVGPEQIPPTITEFPFFAFIDYRQPGKFWGIGDVEPIIPLQREYNKRKAQVIEMFGLMSVGRMLLPQECDVDPDSITNEQGEIIQYVATGNHMPTLMFPVQPPNAFFKHQEEIRKDIEAVAGIYDVTQGRTPKGIQAASAIANLQEAAQTRIRLKARHLDETIRHLGRILLEHFVTYYKATRYIRVLGWDGQPEIIPLQMQELLGPDGNVKLDLMTESGLTMKMTRDEREKRALELYQAGILDDVAVLEEIQYARKDAVLQRKYGAVGEIMANEELHFLMPVLQDLAQGLVERAKAALAAVQAPQGSSGGSVPPPPPGGPSPGG